MDLFSLAAKLTLDSDGFDKGIVGAEKSGKGLASSLEGTFSKIKKLAAGALSVAALKKGFDMIMDLANATSDYGDKIDKQSQALGLSRKAYQEWDYILGQNGASIDSLGVSMKTLNSLVLDAAAGGKESKNAFAQLGLGIHEIEQLEPEKQFEEVVRAFQKMPAGAQKSALAVKIFGRNGMELLPLLNQSATSIDELRARAEELGIIMSDDAVDASVAYNDAMDDLNRTFNGLKYSFGSKLLPVLTGGVQKITDFAAKISKAFQNNGLQGVWDFLVDTFKDIKWPTVEDILGKLSEIWAGVVAGAKDLLKLVFGETADGGIDWPTPEETWSAIQTTVSAWWEAVKGFASNVLKLVFGETEDGGIDWPTAEETWAAIESVVDAWWNALKGSIKNVLKLVLNVPDLPDAHTAGAMLAAKAKQWWEEVKTSVKNAIKWLLGAPDIEDADGSATIEAIRKWWDEKVVPALTDVLNFVLGLFDLPDAAEMARQIGVWWEGVKKEVGNLVLNIIPNFLGFGSAGGDPSDHWTENEGLQAPKEWNLTPKTKGLPGGLAKGMNYVPFDNFPALLHRGEQILTASQARRNRGISGGSTGIDSVVIAAAVSDAIRSAMPGVSVNSYLSGKDITDSVDRDMARRLKARRFAT